MVGTQQLNLQWNNHTSNILQVFLEHLSSETLVDVTLSCEGKFIRAHKLILSACSPYFQEAFANHTDKHPLIILNGMRFEDLRSMIQFMYNGEIRIQESQLEALLAAAETLQVKGLSNVRGKYERGEITSRPTATSSKLERSKISEVAQATTRGSSSPPSPSMKAAVALFGPSVANAARVSPSISSNKSINIAPRPSSAVPVSALAIATIVPSAVSSGKRAVVPILPRPAAATSSLIPISSFTTPPVKRKFVNTKSDDAATFMCVKNEYSPITEITRVSTEVKQPMIEPETPKIRKRRKMAHTVNQLASETVFASNGTVLLEPDEAVSRSVKKNTITVRTDLRDTNNDVDPKTVRVKIQSKQESLLIKREREKELRRIPRPPNAFMIFANEWRRKLALEYPTESNTNISVRLGIMWKGLSMRLKEKFYRLAKQADQEHKEKYPGYCYSPKEARMRKNMRQDRISAKYVSARSSAADTQQELEIIKAYVHYQEPSSNNEDETTCSSELDDSDYVEEEQQQQQQQHEGEPEIILEFSADEEDVKPDLSVLNA